MDPRLVSAYQHTKQCGSNSKPPKEIRIMLDMVQAISHTRDSPSCSTAEPRGLGQYRHHTVDET